MKTILIVDDINDTGKTTESYNEHNHFAVLFERYSSRASAEFVAETVNNDEWLLFPWEQVENVQQDRSDYLESRSEAAGGERVREEE